MTDHLVIAFKALQMGCLDYFVQADGLKPIEIHLLYFQKAN